jgi:CRP-like cAMP-binding protein
MATARTITKVNLLSLDRATFNALFASHPPLRSMFQMLIDQRLRVAADDGETDVPDLGRTQA